MPGALRVVVADADRDHVELGPGLDGAVGAQCDGPAGAVELGQPERLDDVGLLQHQRQHVGPAQLGDVGDRDGLGRLVPAAVDQPAQHAVRARGRGIEAVGGPGHPVGPVGQRQEGQQLLAVARLVPADRAVAVARHHQPAVAGDVDRPDCTRYRALPQQLAVGGVGPQRPVGAEHEALAIGVDGEAARYLVALEGQGRVGQRRRGAVVPVRDRQARLPRGRGHLVSRRVGAQRQVGEIEPRRRLAPSLIAEVDLLAVGRNREEAFLIAQVGLLRALLPAHGPIRTEAGEIGVLGRHQQVAARQRPQRHHGIVGRRQLAAWPGAGIGPGHDRERPECQ